MSEFQPPIKVALLWHMHQPDYREPNSGRLAMPWVRLHALKDYLDMPLRATAHEGVRVTFNLVPSLIDQLQLYVDGGTDRHLELTLRPAKELTPAEKTEILESFFSAHAAHMIAPYARYNELYKKVNGFAMRREVLPSLYSSEEMRDLQVWSNLVWIDPMLRHEEPIKSLFAKQRHFSEEQKLELVDWQRKCIGRIVPAYQDLYRQGRIDVSFTPYYHPILPLLCDTDVAREALPGLTLPKERFRHPEDADRQVRMAVEKFTELFGRPLTGMWPSEGSVSEETLDILIKNGITWAASDEEILFRSLAKSGLPRSQFPLHSMYEFHGLKLFFRDHALSDRIGFVYSGWTAEQAVSDFISHLHNLRNLFDGQLENTVVPIVLDGENAWEYFKDDGAEFLDLLYLTLAHDPLIETVTMTEAAERLTPHTLSSVFSGSWINHNFRIWIGHQEDNAAWDLLSRARNMLVAFEEQHPDFDRSKLDKAWNQILVAEGSDWCWWYGDEHRGLHNAQFDEIFREHLTAVYELVGQEAPLELKRPIHGVGAASFTVPPEGVLTAQIDGRVTHFYEWAGSGFFDCTKAGGAMHRVERKITGIHFAYDHNRFYIRLDFHDRNGLESLKNLRFDFGFFRPNPMVVSVDRTAGLSGDRPGEYQFAVGDIFELAVERSCLWKEGFGSLGFTVTLLDGEQKLETWPEIEPIQIDVPEPNKEIFWPS